jgi:hypothetical protein
MPTWRDHLNGDPLPWLLEPDNAQPAVRFFALRDLLARPKDDGELQKAKAAIMKSGPVPAILAAQDPAGYWVKPGPGYATKYRGTVWQVIHLDQMGADSGDPRVRAACEYVLSHTQAESGGFGSSGSKEEAPPPPSRVIHCLNGNLLQALIGLGWSDDDRVRQAIDWQARSITGEGFDRYYQSGTSGPEFRCVANEKLPCAWGAVKAVGALARMGPDHREPHVQRAIRQGVEFLLSHDPAVADYPFGHGNRPSSSWFKFGYPIGYVTDVLQNLEVLAALGYDRDPRLARAIELVEAKQGDDGRWKLEYTYNGKTWVDIERKGEPSKWVTLRALRVLKAACGE